MNEPSLLCISDMVEQKINIQNYKILVIRLGAIGDIIRTAASVKYLYDNLKNTPEIYWLVENRNARIISELPYIKEIIKVPRKKWQSEILTKNFFNVIKEFKSFIKDLKQYNFDYVIDFHGIFKSGIFSFLSGCKKRIGFTKSYSKEFNHLFNNINLHAESKKITRIEKNFSLLNYFFDIKEIPQHFENVFVIKSEHKSKIDEFLIQFDTENIIGMNPAVSVYGKYKEWYEKYYSELAELLIKKYPDLKIILTWGPDEKQKCENIINGVSEDLRNNIVLAPDTTMNELTYLISKFKLFITGDTGPMHLAAMLNAPVTALFGPSDPVINRPWGSNHLVMYKQIECNPCRKRKCKKLKCQTELKPEFVFNSIIKYLKLENGKIKWVK